MKYVFIAMFIGILAYFVSAPASPTSQPSEKEKLQTAVAYASAVLGLSARDAELVKKATEPSLDPETVALARVEAICHRWQGPVLMNDFCQWMHDVRLSDGLVVSAVDGQETGDGFTALPPSMHSLIVDLKLPAVPDEIPLLYVAVDRTVTADNFSRELNHPSADDAGGSRVVYSIRPRTFPPGFGGE
jgi:hypothetical protein